MALRRHRRVRRGRDGRIRVSIPDAERDVLERMLPQLRELLTLGATDQRTARLFPTAYHADDEAEAEYRRFMHAELAASRLAALDEVEATLGADVLTEAEAMAWMRSLNAIRLVLGTLLDVDEELDVAEVGEDDPDVGSYALYGYLSMLLDELVQAVG